jgi:hypothetical protein
MTTAERHEQWRGRQRRRGLRPLTCYLPAVLADQLTEQGRRFGLSQSVLLELAVEQGLRDGGVLTRPPLFARALHS